MPIFNWLLNSRPQYRRFMHEVLEANGQPILFHCTAGKDRTGFAAAILIRILGVAQERSCSTIFSQINITSGRCDEI